MRDNYKEALDKFKNAQKQYNGCKKIPTLNDILFSDSNLLKEYQNYNNPLKVFEDQIQDCREKIANAKERQKAEEGINSVDIDKQKDEVDNVQSIQSILTKEALAKHDTSNGDDHSVEDEETESTTSTITGYGITFAPDKVIQPADVNDCDKAKASISGNSEEAASNHTASTDSNSAQPNFKVMKNSGGGDCAVYAVRDMLKTIDHPKGTITDSNIQSLRQEICKATTYFFPLYDFLEWLRKKPSESSDIWEQRKNNTDYSSVVNHYKKIFTNFEVFKQIVIKQYINPKLEDSGMNTETLQNLTTQKNTISTIATWGEFEVNTNLIKVILNNCNIFNVVIPNTLMDHNLASNSTSTEYYEYASQDGKWLSLSEISAYLLTLGFFNINAGLDNKFEGSRITFVNLKSEEIYLHNDGIDRGEGYVQGSHWEAIELSASLEHSNTPYKQSHAGLLTVIQEEVNEPDYEFINAHSTDSNLSGVCDQQIDHA